MMAQFSVNPFIFCVLLPLGAAVKKMANFYDKEKWIEKKEELKLRSPSLIWKHGLWCENHQECDAYV